MLPTWADSESWRACLKALAGASSCEVAAFLSLHLSSDELESLKSRAEEAARAPKAAAPLPAPSPVPPAPTAKTPQPPKRESVVRTVGRPASAGSRPRFSCPPSREPSEPTTAGTEVRRHGPTPDGRDPLLHTSSFSASCPADAGPAQRAKYLMRKRNSIRLQEARETMIGQRANGEYAPGILEQERRSECLRDVFNRWDSSSDVSQDGSGQIEVQELRPVLQAFFGWSDQEAEEECNRILSSIDSDQSGTVDWLEFRSFVQELCRCADPACFDNLVYFLQECIGDVSKAQEKRRRQRLLQQLFTEWDTDNSGTVDKAELRVVMERLHEVSSAEGDEIAAMMISRVDAEGEGRLNTKEFQAIMLNSLQPLTPGQFDAMRYRLGRCVESVHANDRTLGLSRYLANKIMPGVLERSSPHTPMVLYGASFDPARAVERLAEANHCSLHPHLITHHKAEREALREMVKLGFQRGHWMYFVIGHGYDGDQFLRDVGVRLQTNAHRGTGMVHKRFRVFVSTIERGIMHWPNILSMRAITIQLDSFQPTEAELADARDAPIVPLTEFKPTVALSLPPVTHSAWTGN
eukprot:TRINITY_DN50498_c0_g1_i1.p1 TRINITY_DN50498_c0_g1~~TRINITY_DN50498_c0_g1_i1.p1  ORF type:complete len:615 (+),score=169.74 TRINITY_DN50498_c0_g1_i1:111-1847(+)